MYHLCWRGKAVQPTDNVEVSARRQDSDSFNSSDFDVCDSDKDKLYLPHGSSEDEGMCITLYSCLNPEILGFSYLSVAFLVAVWHRHIWLSDFKHEIRWLGTCTNSFIFLLLCRNAA